MANPRRNGVEVDPTTDAWLKQEANKWGKKIAEGDPTLKLKKAGGWEVIGVPSGEAGWSRFFTNNRASRKNLDAPYSPGGVGAGGYSGDTTPDVELAGIADLIAQERAYWQDLSDYWNSFNEAIKDPTGPSSLGMGENPWDTWDNEMRNNKWIAPGNDNTGSLVDSWNAPSEFASEGAVRVPFAGGRIYMEFAASGLNPESAEVAKKIGDMRDFYADLWNDYTRDINSRVQTEKNKKSKIWDDLQKLNNDDNKHLNTSVAESFWDFNRIYGAKPGEGLVANMLSGTKFDEDALGIGDGSQVDDIPGSTNTTTVADDVYKGPPDNLPILYGAEGARTSGTSGALSTIRHTADWRGPLPYTGVKRNFNSPLRFIRGFLRGPFGPTVDGATYDDDGGAVSPGGHVLYFHYNPNMVDLSLVFTTEKLPDNQQDPSQLVGSIQGYTVGFGLLFDRHNEMYGVGELGAGSGLTREMDLESAYSHALTTIHDETNSDWDFVPPGNDVPPEFGVLKDLAVLRSVFMMNASGRGAGGRFVAYFGPGWVIHGIPTSCQVQFTHFSQTMIPTRCVVTIQMEQMNPEMYDLGGEAPATPSLAGTTIGGGGLPSDPGALPTGSVTEPGTTTVTNTDTNQLSDARVRVLANLLMDFPGRTLESLGVPTSWSAADTARIDAMVAHLTAVNTASSRYRNWYHWSYNDRPPSVGMPV